jgi:hypothetical protein
MQNNQKKYVGFVKEIQTKFGSLLKISLNYDELEITEDKNGKKWVKLNIAPRREADQWGNTHSVWVDDYKPEQKADYDSVERQAIQDESKDIELNDIPI